MSGHSKWSNIKRRKEATDAVKAKIFTKIGREISVCVKESGADPNVNGKLRDIIAKAKSNNVPNDNINRLIQKASGGDDKNSYEALTYEGYGIGGVAMMVECLTDNKNRTAGDLRHYFDKYGGNLGTTGCVSFMFEQKGIIIATAPDGNEDVIMEDSIESGAEEYAIDDENPKNVRFETPPTDLHAVKSYLEGKGYNVESYDFEYVPSTFTKLADEEQLKKFDLLYEKLEENDDVQNIWHNLDN